MSDGQEPAAEAVTLLDYFAARVDVPWEIAVQNAKKLNRGKDPSNAQIADVRAVLKYLEATAMLNRREVSVDIPVDPVATVTIP